MKIQELSLLIGFKKNTNIFFFFSFMNKHLKSDDVWVMLNDGEPLEFEDKWGKKCP